MINEIFLRPLIKEFKFRNILSFLLDTVHASEPDLATSNLTVFNPYPTLGCPERNSCWPRGFPLGDILNKAWNATNLIQLGHVPLKSFGVLQSLADIQPDVDAVFRMTKTTPLMFDRPEQGEKGKLSFVVR